MNDHDPSPSDTAPLRPAWNKGKIIPRPPLRPGHVWSIRARLHLERRLRDLALFNLVIAASCEAAISLRCASVMSRPMVTRLTEPGSTCSLRADRANAAIDG
jgi:hypothetical protein